MYASSLHSNSSQDQEADSLPVSVQRSAGETVTEDQTDSSLLLLQPFNKSGGQFSGDVFVERQEMESPSEKVEMIPNHITNPASEESTHSGTHVIAENHSPQSQLVPNTSYKGDGSMQVPTQPTQQGQCDDGGVETNSQRITHLEEKHKAMKQKVDHQLEKLRRDNEKRAVAEDARAQSQDDLIREMRLQFSTLQGTCHAPNSLSPIEESFGSLRGEHPYGQVQNSTIVFSPNTSCNTPSWPSQSQ